VYMCARVCARVCMGKVCVCAWVCVCVPHIVLHEVCTPNITIQHNSWQRIHCYYYPIGEERHQQEPGDQRIKQSRRHCGNSPVYQQNHINRNELQNSTELYTLSNFEYGKWKNFGGGKFLVNSDEWYTICKFFLATMHLYSETTEGLLVDLLKNFHTICFRGNDSPKNSNKWYNCQQIILKVFVEVFLQVIDAWCMCYKHKEN